MIPCLTVIVNLSLSTGQLPNCCKVAVVTPIFKGGEYYDPNDDRQTSILPIVSKCIEYSVNEQLSNYFEKKNNLATGRFNILSMIINVS